MSTETEIKIEIQDPEDFCDGLRVFNPRIVSARHFEDNRLFDFPDGTLMSSRSLVRIRQAGGKAFLTYKGPPKAEGVFKTREELETGLDNPAVAFHILERLGLHERFRYQKYRREFEVDGVAVAVDETPVGNYTELEGTETAIYSLARRLGIEESRFIRQSYYSLYLDHCRLKGRVPGDMIFES